jgi:hypothetical protein
MTTIDQDHTATLNIERKLQITAGTKELFVDLAYDAGNWSGTPLFGGNVGGDHASNGHLTHLKKLGLVTTWVDDDDKTCSWVSFTDEGKAYAAALGIDLSWIG